MREFIAWLFWPAFVALTRYMGRCGFILYGSGKGDSPDPPDYTPMATASKEAAEIGAQLGREQLAENKRQYEENAKVAQPVIDAQLDLMKQTKAQGDDYFKYMVENQRPVEAAITAEAMAAGSEAKQAEAAARAEADAMRGVTRTANIIARQGIRYGLSSDGIAKAGEGLTSEQAGVIAAASNAAREQERTTGFAKKMDAAGLYRNLPGASQGAYSLATNAGNSAVGNKNQTAAQYLNGMAAGNATIMQGQQQRISGLGSILNSQTSLYDAQSASAASAASGRMGVVGAGIGAAATYGAAVVV